MNESGVEDPAAGSGGRTRRARAQVNYAFSDYDSMVRTAIRRSQRRDDSPSGFDREETTTVSVGRRGRRGASPVTYTASEAAMMGLRRGRSNLGLVASDSAQDLGERSAMQAQRARSDGDLQRHQHGEGGDGAGESHGGGVAKATTGRGRPRVAPKYARDYVQDFEDVETEESVEPVYVARPSKRRGRPPSGARVSAPRNEDEGQGRSKAKAKAKILEEQRKLDEELMHRVSSSGGGSSGAILFSFHYHTACNHKSYTLCLHYITVQVQN